MIIDSLQYNGKCSCTKEHKMATELCVIQSGCLKEIDQYLKKYLPLGYTVAVYDENTYKATADRHPAVDCEVILDPLDLHANEHGVDLLMEKLPKNAKTLIAIGSGTVHDITRYCAYTLGTEFVSCPSAASVDGFCSSVAAMTWHGCKKTLTAVAPKIVIADIDVIKRAPMRLTRSGFGDMIGKYVALLDWKVGNILTGEFYCERIAHIIMNAAKDALVSMSGIANGDDEAYEKLTFGLLMSGIAMQMMGNSRPASGAEHHISHLIEMSPKGLGVSSSALHGEKVGVGTLLAIAEYQRLASIGDIAFSDYPGINQGAVATIFGEDMLNEILEENRVDAARAVNAKILKDGWQRIVAEIEKLPRAEELRSLYIQFGVKASLLDIGVDGGKEKDLLRYSPLVRNRLTLMRLRSALSGT